MLRRDLLMSSAAAAAGVAVRPETAQRADGPIRIGRTDPRYVDVTRGNNQRWQGSPDWVVIVKSTEQVVEAMRECVRSGRRLSVRSGGHCYENFVFNAQVDVVVDMSGMNQVYFDERMNAFCIEAGVSNGDMRRALYQGWGVTLPTGTCDSIGIGGHIVGGGYGVLSRQFGLTVDHLVAVEVVVADDPAKPLRVRSVVATSSADDPKRDLWWAHTGGGGGNFGIVTRYWFRSPDAQGTDPAALLPRPPSEVLVSEIHWPWDEFTGTPKKAKQFAQFLGNFGQWHEQHSSPDSSNNSLFSMLMLSHKSGWTVDIHTFVDAREPQRLDAFLSSLTKGVHATPEMDRRREMPWLRSTQWAGTDNPSMRSKYKSAYQKRAFLPDQIEAIHRNLTNDFENEEALLEINSYGGRINAVSPGATAAPQRSSVMKLQYQTYWAHAADDEKNLRWVRRFYRDVYRDTGGVPVSNEVSDGCYINYPDVDLGDPKWNTSDVPWHALYYQDAYPALRRAKQRWDPHGLFGHAQSVRPAATA